MKKVGLVSLGCAKNLVDSEMILSMFQSSDFELVSDPKEADYIIVNTCAFIASAKKESIDTIFEMASYGAKIIVVGCLAERYYDQLKEELPEADLIVPLKDYGDLGRLLGELTGEKGINPLNPLSRTLSTPSYMAYLRISEGCDNFCSFCAIPFIRGRFRSRPLEEIIEEAKILRQKGVKEISLVSQDTTIYGRDFKNGPKIVDLLKELEKLGFYSIRLLYLYPGEIEDELISYIASSKVVAHYFDIPVQCASDHLLKLMKRHVNKEETDILFKKIREKCPDAVLRTTLISGFPGETKQDQEETLEWLKEVQFDHLGCFAYSREEGTAAYSYPNQISEKTKKQRRDEILSLQRKISFSKAKTHIGEVMEGIVTEAKEGSEEYRLRSYWNAPDDIDGAIIFTSKRKLKEGEIVKVRISEAFVYDLKGEMVE